MQSIKEKLYDAYFSFGKILNFAAIQPKYIHLEIPEKPTLAYSLETRRSYTSQRMHSFLSSIFPKEEVSFDQISDFGRLVQNQKSNIRIGHSPGTKLGMLWKK